MEHNEEWVIVRLLTDETGFADVEIVGEIFTGVDAEMRARREAERLNRTSRTDLMEVYLARRVGSDDV